MNVTSLRSDRWFERDDEVALLHRAALRSAVPSWRRGSPIVGVADSSSDLNSCNIPIRGLLPVITAGIVEAGGSPFTFPVMSLGEDLVKPSAMLYRNLVAMELEEIVRSHPLDALIVTAGCDKTVAAALMAAAVVDIPTLIVLSGAKSPGRFRGRRLGSGTDLWRALDSRRLQRLSDADWEELENCLACTLGTCNTMGTASTMALVAEAFGVMLPGAGCLQAYSDASEAAAHASGKRIVGMVTEGILPADLMTAASMNNALRVVAAVGGSTNAIIHIAAVAGRLGHPFDLTGDVNEVLREVPLTVNVQPSGSELAGDIAAAGGLPTIMAGLGNLIDKGVTAADGRTWQAVIASAPKPSGPIHELGSATKAAPTMAIVRGSLAPDGAVIKVSAASRQLLAHSGPAFVVENYEDMRSLMDDPELDLPDDVVLVIRGCGPVGAPGMPEWGMAPVPLCLARRGVRDVVRVTDGRMSGTSYGTVVLHISPESAVGGPLALVANGDQITLDVEAGRLDLDVGADELQGRRARWTKPESPYIRGWPALYTHHVLQAPEGCDLDFLAAPTAAHRRVIPAIVGRS